MEPQVKKKLQLLKDATKRLATSLQDAEEVRLGVAKSEIALCSIRSRVHELRADMYPLPSATRAHEELSGRTEAASELTLALWKSFVKLRSGLEEILTGSHTDDEEGHKHYLDALLKVDGEMRFVSCCNLKVFQDVKCDLSAAGCKRVMQLNKTGSQLVKASIQTLDTEFKRLLEKVPASSTCVDVENCCEQERKIEKLKAIVSILGTEKCRVAYVGVRRHSCSSISVLEWSPSLRVILNEKLLCEDIFSGSLEREERSECLAMVAQPCIDTLVQRGEEMATTNQEQDLEMLLDMFQTLCKVTPLVCQVFAGMGPTCKYLRSRVRELHKLTVPVTCTSFRQLKDTMFLFAKDASVDSPSPPRQALPPGKDAGVQPLTIYAMDYLERLLTLHQGTLRQVLAIEHSWRCSSPVLAPLQLLEAEVEHLIESLGQQIAKQSNCYEDSDTIRRRIFVMNNQWYVVKRVKSSNELSSLLGNSWIKAQRSSLKEQALEYHRDAWGALLGLLATEVDGGNRLLVSVRQRMDALSLALDSAYQAHEKVVISDPELRAAVQSGLARKIVSTYRSFLQSYARLLEPGCNALSAQHVEHRLLHHLFVTPQCCSSLCT